MEDAAFVTKILAKFCNWMLSPDGEQKDKKTALQRVLQLKRVTPVTGGGLACLLDEEKNHRCFSSTSQGKVLSSRHKVLFDERPTLLFVSFGRAAKWC